MSAGSRTCTLLVEKPDREPAVFWTRAPHALADHRDVTPTSLDAGGCGRSQRPPSSRVPEEGQQEEGRAQRRFIVRRRSIEGRLRSSLRDPPQTRVQMLQSSQETAPSPTPGPLLLLGVRQSWKRAVVL